jgi:S-adenosylmethionine/arginine decarboxylase-like enzyme
MSAMESTPNRAAASSGTPYGYELVLDLHCCDPAMFTRPRIDDFFTELCDLIEMERCEVHFWDDVGLPLEEQQTQPHTKGTSAVCFILTSSIVIHTLDLLGAVYINIFSCKAFDRNAARTFAEKWFAAHDCHEAFLTRT